MIFFSFWQSHILNTRISKTREDFHPLNMQRGAICEIMQKSFISIRRHTRRNLSENRLPFFCLNLGNLDTQGRSRYIESRGSVARTAAEQWNNKDLGKSRRYHSHRPQNHSSISPPAYC